MRRLDQLEKTVKEAIKAQDRSVDLQQHIPELWQIGSQSAKTRSACSLKKGQHSSDSGFFHSMWEREDGQRRFGRKFMKNLWCFSCGEMHRPREYSYTQLEFKLDSNRRCKQCGGGWARSQGVKVERAR